MSQVRIFLYHDLESSKTFNTRLANVLRPGVYKGYRVRRNAASGSLLDISHGNDPTSVLITVEGVRIQETEELMGVLRVQAADPVYERIDLVVAEYKWSTNNDVAQTYKIIKGNPQRDPDTDPVPPAIENEFQIPLAWIRVRPIAAIGGIARVDVLQDDIQHVAPVSYTKSPDAIASLKPVVDPTNPLRIYVYEGSFPSSDGTSYIDFMGGYSGEVHDVPSEGVRYFLFGLSDQGNVEIAAEGDEATLVQSIGYDVLPICIAKAANKGGTTAIESLIDVRFPFARKFQGSDEEDIYKNLLSGSVFKYAAIDTIGGHTFIDLDSLSPADSNLTAVLNRGDTSLAVTWAGSSAIGQDVTIATKNVLLGSALSGIRHILVSAESNVSGLKFDYSASSGYSGFTGKSYDLDTIIEVPGGASKLFIQFKIPKENFPAKATVKIFGYAVLMSLDYDMLNAQSISNLGLDSIGYAVTNLIPNGDFRIWSRPLFDKTEPNIDSRVKISYPIRKDTFASRENIFAADGWQFTRLDFDADNGVISRVLWSRDVVGSLDENTMDTALEWIGQAGTSRGLNYLEFRVPCLPEYVGQKVTFSFEHRANPREAVGIKLVLYSRDEAGNLAMLDDVESGPLQSEGTLTITSNIEIMDKVYAAGFIIVFAQTSQKSTVYVRRARASIGSYRVLPFTRPANADELVRKYYERGQAFSSGNVEESEEVGASVQYGSSKLTGLSENAVVRVRSVRDRSVNIVQANYQGNRDGFVVRAVATTTGLAVVDTDWEAAIIYPTTS